MNDDDCEENEYCIDCTVAMAASHCTCSELFDMMLQLVFGCVVEWSRARNKRCDLMSIGIVRVFSEELLSAAVSLPLLLLVVRISLRPMEE